MAALPPPGPAQPPSGPPSGQYPASPPAYQAQYQQYGGYPAPAVARKRTAALLIAQIFAIIEGIVFMLLGIGSILLGVAFRSRLTEIINNGGFSSTTNLNGLADVATGVFIGIGVFLLVYFAFFVWAAVIAGRPSTGGRVVVVILDVILVLLSLASLRGVTNNSGYLIGHLVFWAVQAVILFGMAVHGTVERRVA